jgi:dTDP-glucose 4,6-dehydratase
MANILVTGGAGFIGTSLVYKLLNETDNNIVIIDKLTYASNSDEILELSQNNPRVDLIDVCISDIRALQYIYSEYKPVGIYHLAAESHVDNSIKSSRKFIETNIIGTYELLEITRALAPNIRFIHVSTDEVYGDLALEAAAFTEETPYDPSSPYSASKASSDHLVRAWHRTYGLNTVVTNCSNNYGPRQHEEKLIPCIINRALEGKELPIYGDGKQIRDWLYVGDHCDALISAFKNGKAGATYNIGGNNEIQNIDIVKCILNIIEQETGKKDLDKLITYVKDRPGHDRRYAIDSSKIKKDIGWEPSYTFSQGIHKTVKWFLNR